MQGFLDVLEPHALRPAPVWTRRFVTLDAAFRALETFADASQRRRVARVDLAAADVQAADALGERLVLGSGRAPQLSRRFVFCVQPRGSSRGLFFCAALDDEDTAASREYLNQWLTALRAVAGSGGGGNANDKAVDIRELKAVVATYLQRLHVSAQVTARLKPAAVADAAQYVVAVKAWVLAQERVGGSQADWQVAEYAVEWVVRRSSAQLRGLDARLRQFARRELRDVMLPSVGPSLLVVTDADAQRRAAKYDAYLQLVLRLPALSTLGSDAGVVLDEFLEVTGHVAALRRVERETGQSLQLNQRRVVPWDERTRFEAFFQLHQEMQRSQQQHQARREQQQNHVQPKQERHERHEHREQQERARNRSEASSTRQHRHHHHQSRRESEVAHRAAGYVPVVDEMPIAPLPPSTTEVTAPPESPSGEDGVPPAPMPVRKPSTVEAAHNTSVEERMARIGHKLIVEAFMLPARQQSAATTPTTVAN